MANDRNFKVKNGLDVEGGSLTQTKSGDSKNYFRSSTSDRAYAYFQNSSTGTADTDGLLVGINSAESALIYHQEATPMYIGSNGVVQRLTLESDGDLLVYNTNASTVVAKFNASTENVELAGDIVFEGSTADANETTVTVTNPTADQTFTIPDQTGTAMLWQQPWPDDPASTGNIAIGDNTLSDLTSSGQRNVAIGSYSLSNVTNGDFNTAVGALTLNYLTTGGRNVAVGTEAGSSSSATTVTDNTYVGHQAGQYSTGSSNTSIGKGAGGNTSTSNFMVNLGYQAGYESGSYGVNIGYQAGYNASMNSGAVGHVLVGYLAGDNIRTGDYNVLLGYAADTVSTSSSTNVGIGKFITVGNSDNVNIGNQHYQSSSADRNVAIGLYSGGENSTTATTGDDNIGIGYYAGRYVQANNNIYIGREAGGTGQKTGHSNVGIGYRCLKSVSSGGSNVALGYSAGRETTTGGENTYLGTIAGSSGSGGHATGSNCSILGYNSAPSSSTVSNEITLGNSNITSLRCNVTTISSLSDERDKTDIEDLPYGLDFINDMRPVQFTWDRRDGSMNNVPDFGFIAQDLHDVELEHSSTNRTRLVKWENPDKLEADYVRSYPILVKAVQELSAKCDALEARLAALEGV